MPCTTILVGKKASYDGSTLMARNEDSGSGHFMPKKFEVITPEKQPKVYRAVLSEVEIPLPENPMRYTSMPNAVDSEGIWGEAGVNELNVAMSETETLTSNPRVLGTDPLVKNGIGEEDLLTITLPYIRSAREGVERLGMLTEKYGTYEMNGIGFQDVDEIWWFETVGGHHWMAKRVPDDAYVIVPNQLGIDSFDFVDAFGERKNHMCSADMIAFVKSNHLDLSMDGVEVENNTAFDPRAAFGSHSDSDHCYNTPRAWDMLRNLNPNTYPWKEEGPESDRLPWSMVPEKKISIEDVKYVLSLYFQGTEYNPYARHGKSECRGMYRPIAVNRNNFVKITQLRPYMPREIMAVEWIAEGSNTFNGIVPFYSNVTCTPEYLANATDKATTENFYWANRYMAVMADAHFNTCIADIERYQLKLNSAGHRMIAEFDREFIASKPENVQQYLEECNNKIADFAKQATYETLGKVMLTASCGMKNGYARSDG